jgi:hypothetical protein
MFHHDGLSLTFRTSSIVIDSLTRESRADPTIGVLYFYFDFSIPSSQSYNSLLPSLIWQLSLMSDEAARILQESYQKTIKVDNDQWAQRLAQKHCGISVAQSLVLLGRMIQIFSRLYVVVDALDECSERGALLQTLTKLWENQSAKINFFLVSRQEGDIEDSLNGIAEHHIICQETLVNEDIRTYIRHQLANGKAFAQWPEGTRSSVEETLCLKCQGM